MTYALEHMHSVIDGFEWFWMESLQKNIQLMLEFIKAPFLVLHFSCYTLMTFLTMLSIILLFMLMILLPILVLFDGSNNSGSADVKMDGSVLEEKSSFKMLRLTSSSKSDWGSYIISIAKTASKRIEALIHSMKFPSS